MYSLENTIEAFEKAVQLGVDGIGLGVHQTTDDEIVVIHDDRLERASQANEFDCEKWDFSIPIFHSPILSPQLRIRNSILF